MVFIDGSCIVDDLSGAAGEQPAETREVLVQLREKKHLPGALNHTVATSRPLSGPPPSIPQAKKEPFKQ